MLQQLEQISRALDTMFEATIEGFTTRGLDEDALWDYYQERYNYYNNLLQTTDDPSLIIEYTQQMLRILNNASGMLTDEQWQEMAGGTGMTWQEWFLSVTADAQDAADAAVATQNERIQEQWEILWAQMDETTNTFYSLSEVIDPVIPPLEELPNLLDDFGFALIRATELLSDDGGNKSADSGTEVIVNISGGVAALKPMVKTEVINYSNSMRNDLRRRVTKKGAFN